MAKQPIHEPGIDKKRARSEAQLDVSGGYEIGVCILASSVTDDWIYI